MALKRSGVRIPVAPLVRCNSLGHNPEQPSVPLAGAGGYDGPGKVRLAFMSFMRPVMSG